MEEGEANAEQANGQTDQPHGVMVRVEVERDIPMSLTLPIEVQPDAAHQPFPYLDTTLADLGIQE